MPILTEQKFSLLGNDSQHVVFTEVNSGKAKVCGLKGGVHLLKYFLEDLQLDEENLDLGKAMKIELQRPHWSIELSKKKRKKEGKNGEMEEFFQVGRHLHIDDPSLKKIETNLPSDKRTGVLLLEDSVRERDLSVKEVFDIYSLVNGVQENDLLVCKISRPLSKKYRVNLREVPEKEVSDAAELKGILKEYSLLANEDVNLDSLAYPTTVLAYLAKATDTSLLDVLIEKYQTLETRPIIIVDAEDLRKEDVQLSYHLSWSKTMEEFEKFTLSKNPFMADLEKFEKNAPHLIVRFGCDGVIHYDKENSEQLHLYYANSKFVEGDYVQHRGTQMIGEATAFTAGLVSTLAGSESDMNDAILHGMKAACWLVNKGFQFYNKEEFMYPSIAPIKTTKEVAEEALEEIHLFNRAWSGNKSWTIVRDDISKVETGRWSILTGSPFSKKLFDLAKDIVQCGTDTALKDKPTAQFGDLVTVDREEMENFRGIANLVQGYMKAPQTKPLSIGVFGFPGAGKSFGVGEVIKAVASGQGKTIHKLEFNLSQFLEYSDLLAAFQSIRDQTFSNKVPVVMFDEFDCSFGGKALGWLQYFLAPMQDGKFLERGHLRPLGSAIFIFVGGTSPTFAEFQATAREPAAVAAKKPDFVSRLRGSVDIWGPNKLGSRDDSDETYTVRRAIILRSLLERNELAKRNEKFEVADGVLTALLCVSGFHHGTRSLEAIIKMGKITPDKTFTAAELPSNDRLTPYVDPIEFGEWLKGWRVNNELKRKDIEENIYHYKPTRVTSSTWEPNYAETVLLSKAVAKNISSFLDSGEASDLTKWQGIPYTEIYKEKETDATDAEEKAEKEAEKIKQAIAHGVYDQLKAIRSDRETTSGMMPWWFIKKRAEAPDNKYFQIADVVWNTLTAELKG